VATLGKFLPALGLVLLPYALWYGLTTEGEGVIAKELLLVAGGAAAFLLGRKLEARARP
jgi:hypothetical protein